MAIGAIMQTNHVEFTRTTTKQDRPEYLPFIAESHFCKARYSQNDQRCYTARLLDIFLDERCPYIAAYKEFRLKTMDVLYRHFKDDHASNAEQRAKCFNIVAQELGYDQLPMEQYQAWWAQQINN